VLAFAGGNAGAWISLIAIGPAGALILGPAIGAAALLGKPGELPVEEHEADVIRRIFQEDLEGASPRQIAHDLNAEGILPPRGTTWNASTLNGSADRGYGILRNAIYAYVLA